RRDVGLRRRDGVLPEPTPAVSVNGAGGGRDGSLQEIGVQPGPGVLKVRPEIGNRAVPVDHGHPRHLLHSLAGSLGAAFRRRPRPLEDVASSFFSSAATVAALAAAFSAACTSGSTFWSVPGESWFTHAAASSSMSTKSPSDHGPYVDDA